MGEAAKSAVSGVLAVFVGWLLSLYFPLLGPPLGDGPRLAHLQFMVGYLATKSLVFYLAILRSGSLLMIPFFTYGSILHWCQ